MNANEEWAAHERPPRRRLGWVPVIGAIVLLPVGIGVYHSCKIEVSKGQQAVLIRSVGLDLEPSMELAPAPKNGRYYKGVQTDGQDDGVLREGRYFYNPFYWSWEIMPQFEVPQGKIGVRIAMNGAPLPTGQVIAAPGQKGILGKVLEPGLQPYNPYATAIELHDPVRIPAGFRGVVTLLAGADPKKANQFLVERGERGVQPDTLEPGTYYFNPYEKRVSLVDCRSKRFNLSENQVMDFLSADGFPITLDGVVEFRLIPERVAEVFVKYNEHDNGDAIDDEIIAKIITPESRSLCRIGGSKLSGGQFISGTDREQFQRDLVSSLTENCKRQGIEILAVAVTTIHPPEEIATPVRAREVAKQELAQFNQEKIQQQSEAQLRVEQVLAEQKKKLVEAEQAVVQKTTRAEQEQEVAVTLAAQKLKVAETQLEAAKDKAAAITAKANADAAVIRFNNAAEVAGLAARVAAFDGDGAAMARNTLVSKIAPAFRTILSNSEGPLMELFGQFTRVPETHATDRPAPRPASSPPRSAETRNRPNPELPSEPFTRAEVRP
jgi:regulator of protease activity HflC (stomatin/prohibitin superfamily)